MKENSISDVKSVDGGIDPFATTREFLMSLHYRSDSNLSNSIIGVFIGT